MGTLKKITLSSISPSKLGETILKPPKSDDKGELVNQEEENTETEQKENKQDDVDKLRQMLAELAGSGERVETVQSGEARKQAQISSVGAAFGSFNHDNLIKSKSKEDSSESETQV